MLRDGSFVIALIPARGGSKGIPRKNLVELNGLPLIAYTIKAAQKSLQVDEIWVTSDDEEILAVAESFGAKSLVRSYDASNDEASAIDVVDHFLASNALAIELNTVIIYLQPTSPLRSEKHVDESLRIMEEAGVHGVVSVVEAEKPPYKAFGVDSSGCLKSLFDERLSNARRQDLPQSYFPNGAIYAFRVKAFIARKGFPTNGSLPYVMPHQESVDIDSEQDLLQAERLLRGKNGSV